MVKTTGILGAVFEVLCIGNGIKGGRKQRTVAAVDEGLGVGACREGRNSAGGYRQHGCSGDDSGELGADFHDNITLLREMSAGCAAEMVNNRDRSISSQIDRRIVIILPIYDHHSADKCTLSTRKMLILYNFAIGEKADMMSS